MPDTHARSTRRRGLCMHYALGTRLAHTLIRCPARMLGGIHRPAPVHAPRHSAPEPHTHSAPGVHIPDTLICHGLGSTI